MSDSNKMNIMWNSHQNIMMWIFSIYIITLLPAAVSQRPHCIKTDKCDCTSGSKELELNCPKNMLREGIVIHIEEIDDSPEWMIRIDCFGDIEYMDILPVLFVPKVTYLRLQSCPLPKYGFQTLLNTFNITDLQYLRYELYDLEDTAISEDYFVGLESVVTLIFTENNMINIDANIFRRFPNLQYLDLYRNNISLVPELFTHLQKLKRLSVAKNSIQTIPDNVFQNLKELQILEMWSNNITILNNKSFFGLNNLLSLELSFNDISFIQESTFDNLVYLVNISLASNKIESLPKDLFSKNKELKLIRLMNNPLKLFSDYQFSALSNLIEINLSSLLLEEIPENIFWLSKKLEKVDLSHNHLHKISKDLFRDTSSLKALYLSANDLQNINHEAFINLNELEILRLEHNSLYEISQPLFSTLRNIVEIDLSHNNISKIHPLSFQHNENLQTLSLSHNNFDLELIADSTPFTSLTNIRSLNLSHNVITRLNIQEFILTKRHMHLLDVSYNKINKIEISEFIPYFPIYNIIVDLSYNNIEEVSFSPFINELLPDASEIDALHPPQSLTKVIVSHNPIKCDCEAVDLSKYFKGLLDPRLRALVEISSDDLICAFPDDFKNIIMAEVPVDKLVCPCTFNISEDCRCLWRGFDDAIVADCAGRGLTYIPNISLPRKYNKVEVDLSNNSLIALSERTDYENVTKLILSNNVINNLTWVPPHIEILYLDNNQLGKINPFILEILNDSRTLTNLTLSNNPWTCDCSAKNFTEFLRHNFRKVDAATVRCKEDNKTIASLSEKYLCYRSKENLLISMIVIISTLLFLVALAAVYFTYRREIKIWLFAKNLCLWLITEEELDQDKKYDAFVSYSHKDEDFVENFVEILENGPQPYKLCLHYRDWIPGKYIAEQIVDSVNDSKRTIIILSNNFLESVWAKMEFQTAHIQAMKERKAKVIIVLYDDIDIETLDEDLKLYMKTNTYVKWGDPWFWNKLRYALPHENKKRQRNAQKHANMMMTIENKFTVSQQPLNNGLNTGNQVFALDAESLMKHSLSLKAKKDLQKSKAS